MAFKDPGHSGGSGFSAGRKRKRKREAVQEPPHGDVQSSGGDYGIPEANKAKRHNKRVRRNTREVYKQQAPEQRKRIARNTRKRSDETSRMLQHEHQSRVARNREIEKGAAEKDTKDDSDLQRAQRYLEVHDKILHPKRKQKAGDIFLDDPKQLKAAGFSPEKEGLITAPMRVPLTLARAGEATIETAVEHPDQIPRLVKDSGEAVLSIPAGLIRTGLHPKKAVEEIAKDYSHRYGGLYNNKPGAKKEFKKRQEKEGIAPEVFDIASLVAGSGVAGGRALQKVAEAGNLGKPLERIATERPRLQVSGAANEQRLSRNLGVNVAHAAVDALREKKGKRQVAKAAENEDHRIPVETAEAARRSDLGIPTVAPLSHAAAKRAQRMKVATRKGKAIVRQKVEQGAADRAAFHALRHVDQAAFKYATQYGIRNADQGKEVLTKLKAHIEHHREKDGREVPKRQDELKNIDRLLSKPEVFDDPKLHKAVADMAVLSRGVAKESPGITEADAAPRRVAAQAELHGVVQGADESPADFLRRADAARDAHAETRAEINMHLSAIEHSIRDNKAEGNLHLVEDLERQRKVFQHELKKLPEALAPGEYYPSRKRLDSTFLYRTTGGSKAQADVRAYTGKLTRTGREATSNEVYMTGIHKEIRRKHNWNLVSAVFEDHTLPWSREKTLSQLQDEVDARNIDPDSVAYVNMAKVKRAQSLEGEGSGGEHADPSFGTGDAEIEKLLNDAFVNPKAVSTVRDDFDKTGWAIVPAEVAKELQSGFKQASVAGRAWRVGKGKISRTLLSNPVWLQFQIASNALQSGLHRTGMISVIKAHYKFKQDEWKAIESDIGVHKFYDEQAKLGAAATNNHLVNGWRAWQKVGAGSKLVGVAHPVREFFDLFHRADTAQNNLFRRAVMYNDVKREAYRRMATDSGRMVAGQQRIMNTLKLKDPQELMDAIIRDPRQFEQHAQAVDDFLGNWTSYTSRERAILGNALFGGFIRFSTKLAFYTMPVKHPIMSSIMLQMGRLERDELQRIFGTDVPEWEIGNYYSADGKQKFQALRLNPYGNALTSMATEGVPQALVGSVSPVVGMVLDQLGKGNIGFQQPWNVNSKQIMINTPVAKSDRLKILISTFLKLSPYYRNAEKYGVPGVVKPLRGRQQTTSSLVFPEPREYNLEKSKRKTQTQEAIDRNNKLKAEQGKANPLGAIFPVMQSGSGTIESARQFAASKDKKKKKKSSNPYGPSTDNPYAKAKDNPYAKAKGTNPYESSGSNPYAQP